MKNAKMSRRTLLQGASAGLATMVATPLQAGEKRSKRLIGYTEYRTNLPGGRHANIVTMRACVVREDGTGRRVLAESLTKEPNAWTQFSGWSPDGKTAIIGRGWESKENGAWEEAHKTFRFSEGWLYDMYLLTMRTGKTRNVTSVDRVSTYNTGLFYWPKQPNTFGFQALIKGDSHPFRMDGDGQNKRDLTEGSREFAYGFNATQDGKRIAYHKNYQVWIADSDGSHATHIKTGKPFNFVPQWSPDGERLLFLSGEHYDCHPYTVRRDGSELRQIGDRKGYKGVVDFLDVFDFHSGSSDLPVWSADGNAVFYTAKIGTNVELMRATLDGKTEQITHSTENTLHYHSVPAPEGGGLLFGSNRSGIRQLYVMPTNGGEEVHAITSVKEGWGALWGHWQPMPTAK